MKWVVWIVDSLSLSFLGGRRSLIYLSISLSLSRPYLSRTLTYLPSFPRRVNTASHHPLPTEIGRHHHVFFNFSHNLHYLNICNISSMLTALTHISHMVSFGNSHISCCFYGRAGGCRHSALFPLFSLCSPYVLPMLFSLLFSTAPFLPSLC